MRRWEGQTSVHARSRSVWRCVVEGHAAPRGWCRLPSRVCATATTISPDRARARPGGTSPPAMRPCHTVCVSSWGTTGGRSAMAGAAAATTVNLAV